MSSRQPILAQQIDTGTAPGKIPVINSKGAVNVGSTAVIADDGDLTTKLYVDTVARGLIPHAAAKVATTQAIDLHDAQTIDGVGVVENDRVLVVFGSTTNTGTASIDNGVWVVKANGAWTRALDFDNNPANEIGRAHTVPVLSGNTQAGTTWMLITSGTITIGTTPLEFTQLSPSYSRLFVEKSGDTMTGPLVLSGAPSAGLHAATKSYVDTAVSTSAALKLNLAGGTMQGAIAMGNSKITGIGAATALGDALSWGQAANVSTLSINGTSFVPSNYLTTAAAASSYVATTIGAGQWIRGTDANSTDPILGILGANAATGRRLFQVGIEGITNGLVAARSGNNITWDFSSTASFTINGNDLGRWAAIDPSTKLTITPASGNWTSIGWSNGGALGESQPLIFSSSSYFWGFGTSGDKLYGFESAKPYGSANANYWVIVNQNGGNITFNRAAVGPDFQATSDMRLKTDVHYITDAATKIRTLRGIVYRLLADPKNRMMAGLSAQQVQQVLPEAVSEDEDGFLSVSHSGVNGLIVEAINEILRNVDLIDDKLSKMDDKLNKLEDIEYRLSRLESNL